MSGHEILVGALASALMITVAILLLVLKSSSPKITRLTRDWVYGGMPTPFALLDGEGKFKRLNAAAKTFFELGAIDPTGLPVADYLPDSVAPMFLYHLQTVKQEKQRLFIANMIDSFTQRRTAKGFVLTPLPGKAGIIGDFMLFICDVTDEESPSLTRDDLLGKINTKYPLSPDRPSTATDVGAQAKTVEGEAPEVARTVQSASTDQGGDKAPLQEKTAMVADNPKKVLLVEDNMIIRKVAGSLIGQAGYVVEFAVNGSEAVEKCQTTLYDVVLMDLFMPVMNGDEATRRIRQIPGPAAKVPILAVTATDQQEDVRHMTEAGVDGFLPKPFTLEQLIPALRDLLPERG